MPLTPATGLVRDARPDEAPLISALAHQTFRETYAAQTRPEDMDAFLAEAYRPTEIAPTLTDPRHRRFVTELEGSAVGFMHLVGGEHHESVQGQNPVLLAEIYLNASIREMGIRPGRRHVIHLWYRAAARHRDGADASRPSPTGDVSPRRTAGRGRR